MHPESVTSSVGPMRTIRVGTYNNSGTLLWNSGPVEVPDTGPVHFDEPVEVPPGGAVMFKADGHPGQLVWPQEHGTRFTDVWMAWPP